MNMPGTKTQHNNMHGWENLTGIQLSAFITNGCSINHFKEFAKHLEINGTHSDFANWIERNPQFMQLELALQAFPNCPTLAHTWLITKLNTADPEVHYKVLIELARLHMFNGVVADLALDALKYVDCTKIECSKLSKVFNVLLKNKCFATIEENWEILLPIMTHNPIQVCIDAARNGCDLRARFPECVIPVESIPDYFNACCTGGLIENARLCNIAPEDHQTIINAFVLAMSQNKKSEPVLNYLWDTYPATPWHYPSAMLSNLLYVSDAIAQKIVEHHRIHAPQYLEDAAVYLTASALSNDCPKSYDLLLPFVEAKDVYKVVYSAMGVRREKVMMDLLQLPNAEENFAKALEMCAGLDDSESVQWGTEMYNKRQNQLLHKNINTLGAPKHPRKI